MVRKLTVLHRATTHRPLPAKLPVLWAPCRLPRRRHRRAPTCQRHASGGASSCQLRHPTSRLRGVQHQRLLPQTPRPVGVGASGGGSSSGSGPSAGALCWLPASRPSVPAAAAGASAVGATGGAHVLGRGAAGGQRCSGWAGAAGCALPAPSRTRPHPPAPACICTHARTPPPPPPAPSPRRRPGPHL